MTEGPPAVGRLRVGASTDPKGSGQETLGCTSGEGKEANVLKEIETSGWRASGVSPVARPCPGQRWRGKDRALFLGTRPPLGELSSHVCLSALVPEVEATRAALWIPSQKDRWSISLSVRALLVPREGPGAWAGGCRPAGTPRQEGRGRGGGEVFPARSFLQRCALELGNLPEVNLKRVRLTASSVPTSPGLAV